MNERVRLEREINELKYELSVTIPQEMQTAIEMGDLRENSEFSDAVTRQHFVNIRLKQLADRLSACKAVDIHSIPRDKVGIGSVVKVRNLETNKIMYFKLIMSEISNHPSTEHTEVTVNSPIGKALTNKKIKDEVVAVLPNGRSTYRILNITTIHDL